MKELGTFLEKHGRCSIEQPKYSYVIIKPNGEKKVKEILNTITSQGFCIEGWFAINDYANLNYRLHPEEEKQKFIIPITRMYNDCYGNYAILLLLSKSHVTFEHMVKQIGQLKAEIRDKFSQNYMIVGFDLKELDIQQEERNWIYIHNHSSQEKASKEGNWIITTMPNLFHAPDADAEVTLTELNSLCEMGILSEEKKIPSSIQALVLRFKSFEIIKDLTET